jgi:hypothetical protein
MSDKHDKFMADLDRRVEKFDRRIDEAVAKFDASFPAHINQEIADIQADLTTGHYLDTPFSGDRYVNGVCCKTQRKYDAAYAKFYGP